MDRREGGHKKEDTETKDLVNCLTNPTCTYELISILERFLWVVLKTGELTIYLHS